MGQFFSQIDAIANGDLTREITWKEAAMLSLLLALAFWVVFDGQKLIQKGLG